MHGPILPAGLAAAMILALPGIALGHAEGSNIVVQDAAGSELARGGVNPDDDMQMTVDLPDLAAGSYVANWTAVTPDDQGVTRGTISFTVGPAASPSPQPTAAPAAPDSGQPISSDLLLALLIAVIVVGLLASSLLRRRS